MHSNAKGVLFLVFSSILLLYSSVLFSLYFLLLFSALVLMLRIVTLLILEFGSLWYCYFSNLACTLLWYLYSMVNDFNLLMLIPDYLYKFALSEIINYIVCRLLYIKIKRGSNEYFR
ncbi:MAG: hypothetical protein BGO44_13945 [Legionella sp. 39-23]|nr:MAG: hypothetical protein BGO44_13945 [Legionella sp. 39-23]